MSDRDLAHHYKVLKQFLDISDDQTTRSKTHASRAERAREKLLKLSYTQFKELSTDVYDELKRRIDESKGEPDYLLPKNSFHPKRNQARQKLASLPQNRFKDLVSDISYELERRDLHKEGFTSNGVHQRTTSNSPSLAQHAQLQQESHVTHQDSYYDDHHLTKNKSISSLLTRNEFEEEKHEYEHGQEQYEEEEPKQLRLAGLIHSETSHSIQPTKVVPTKANLDWSSDEEEEEEEKKIKPELHRQYSFESNSQLSNLDKSFEEAPHKHEPEVEDDEEAFKTASIDQKPDSAELLKLQSQLEQVQQRLTQSQKEKEDLQQKLESIQDDHDYSLKQNKSLSEQLENINEEKHNWTTKIQELQEELEKVKSTNSTLKLENQSIKSSHPNITLSPPPKKSINRDIDLFLEKLENLDITKANSPASSLGSSATPLTPLTSDLRNQVKLWQRRYEELRSSNIAKDVKKSTVNKPELKSFVSPQGLISIRLVSDVYALIDSFLLYIGQRNFDPDILFEKISKISIIVNEIANQGENNHLNSNEHSIMIREAVTHALTVTRYHATYKNLLPKFIVEKAINELMFLVCDLISVSKLNENSTNIRMIDLQHVEPKNKNHQRVPSTNEDFGVRPLKMANKLKQRSPIQTKSFDVTPKKKEQESSLVEPESEPVSKLESSPFIEKKNYTSLPRHKTPEKSIGSLGQKLNGSPRNVTKLASKFETPTTTPVSTPSKSSTFPLSKDRSTPSPNGGVRDLAERLTSSAEKSESPVRTIVGKKSILDKVRQYETSPQQQRNVNNNRVRSESIESNHSLNSEGVSNEEKVSSGRNLLQSLKDQATKVEKSSSEGDAGTTNKSDTTLSDNELENSTAETTPSQESDEHGLDEDEKTPNVSTVNESTPVSQDTLPGREITNIPDRSESVNSKSTSSVNEKKVQKPSKTVTIQEPEPESESDEEDDAEMERARQRQEARKSMAAAHFNIDLFDIDDPDNTLTQVLLYLEHQTVEVINTIQSLLVAIKKPEVTRGELRMKSSAITDVITQMTEATRTSMNQTRNHALKEHGSWVVQSLEDCTHRMTILCKPREDKSDSQFGDKNFKQRLAGISFDIAKCIKELVKSVEEASLKEDIAQIETRMNHIDDLN